MTTTSPNGASQREAESPAPAVPGLAPASPLEGLRVLDLAGEMGFLCGRILADLGADVIKVEPPTGDPGRRLPPFAEDRPEMERSLTWLATNVNKRGITCNLDTFSGRDLFRRLVEHADVVVESFAPGYLDERGLGYDELAKINPGLILTTVTPYGLEGPRSDMPGSDLEVWASSGSLWLAGDPDGSPVRSTLPQSPFWAGLGAGMGTLMAIVARDTLDGQGQHVDVSAQASAITAISHAPAFWDILREEQSRSGPFLTGRSVTGAKFRNIWPCKDGYVTFALYGGPAGKHTSRQLVAWMDEKLPEGAPAVLKEMDWEQFDVNTILPDRVRELETAIAPFVLTITKREFFEGVVKRNMLGYSVANVEDIAQDEQLEARGFWQSMETPWDGAINFPGSFALFNGERPTIRRTAPRLGEHNVEVYGGELGLSTEDIVALKGVGAL